MTLNQARSEIASLSRALAMSTARIAELEQQLAWSDGRRGSGTHRAPGFTVVETRILRILAARGFVGHGQMDALYRHVSNIRKKLPRGVKVRTVIGEGYEVEAGGAILKRLVEAPQSTHKAKLSGLST